MSGEFFSPSDRVLIVDDFLASGQYCVVVVVAAAAAATLLLVAVAAGVVVSGGWWVVGEKIVEIGGLGSELLCVVVSASLVVFQHCLTLVLSPGHLIRF